jgi:hypothetical protein
MCQPPSKDTSLLDQIIVGRVEPHIYAFTTQTIPNYLKVGDTYRPVSVRLNEWSLVYPHLKHVYTHTARIDDNTIFRDYAVHDFLEHTQHKHRLEKSEIPPTVYYSPEFFQSTLPEDVDEAIADIQTSAVNNEGRYPLYTSDHLPQKFTYRRGAALTPRANQQEVINNFNQARKHKRTNLLMFAAMRFGKSFTSMCCACEMSAHKVLVVSAKADVKEEWKATVEGIGNFEGYIFADKEQLLRDEHFLKNCTRQGQKVVLFLTLQDLQGDRLKAVHKEVFAAAWDLLLVDETHFGARAKCYGNVLTHKDNIPRDGKDIDTLDSLDEVVKRLKVGMTIHLSGTPYRILMGSEFEQEDIIAFVPFTDIATAQKQWDVDHQYDEQTPEWANPYFGFPEMVRFAFLPNQASLDQMAQLKAQGATASFSELFRPKSLISTGDYTHFCHEAVVLDFLQVIDGVKDDTNVLGFLDNERIKAGKLCRHMVMVLPYCASCDAMERLLTEHATAFRNLSEYQILNISGLQGRKAFKDTKEVKLRIAECEKRGQKTITLTVHRMLTGNTVPQWDTMLFLRQSESPEEYDQAIFRLQNPYVDEYLDERQQRIKFNLKPQTILVDFDPERVFRFQEQKSQIYNLNVEKQGNTKLKERIEKELKISPVIILDHNKLREVTATNILDAVRSYAQTRSVLEEAIEIPIDYSLLDNKIIQEALRHLQPIDVKSGFFQPPHWPKEGEATDDVAPAVAGDGDATDGSGTQSRQRQQKEQQPDDITQRFAACYAQILFFAFLTDDRVSSLEEVLRVMHASSNNKRLSQNLGLQKEVLRTIQKHCNGFMLRKLDYKIQNINTLIHDGDKTPLERIQRALTKFGRMSNAEVVTPAKTADELIALLPDNLFDDGAKVLDVASKRGEMLTALMRRYGAEAGQQVYSICTSPLAYEFTHKVYAVLALPLNHIYHQFTSFDLIDKSKPEILTQLKKMNFRAIVSNPPYQVMDGGGTGSSAVAIYNNFVTVAKDFEPKYVCMIMPAKWYSGGRGLDDFREDMLNDTRISTLIDFTDSRECFPAVDVAGGICYFLWDERYEGKCNVTNVANGQRSTEQRYLNEYEDTFIRDARVIQIIHKVIAHPSTTETLNQKVYARKPFGLPSFYKGLPAAPGREIRLLGSDGISYLAETDVPQNIQLVPRWKVIMSKAAAEHAGQTDREGRKRIISRLEVLPPGTICTESYLLLDTFESEQEAKNMLLYMRTQFVRFLLSSILLTQNIVRDKFRFVPLQDFTSGSDIDWSVSVQEIDKQLYRKYGLSEDERSFIESTIKPM